ncbi:hypothetical protein HPB51_029845 [Rhipicephalus microplus]|uniref:HTH OST-type domain-containing protein n=1 Tax=Rhipicephalus microplus TaxID=6941 RepID=A0A9J6CTB0_RHIMP|nr:hypothetical protein HPB51_029845 [Rhipicephalus microplus]
MNCNNVTLKAMPGLTSVHLNPNNFEKMRVNYAFQLFGDHVITGLQFYKGRFEPPWDKIDATLSFFSSLSTAVKAKASLSGDLSDVKCVIRALLVVNNGPMSYLTLMKQYKAQEGRAIPYSRFNYTDCVSFLESLTDTVDVIRNGNDVLVSAKIEENLRHVQALVQAQKVRKNPPTSTSPPAKVQAQARAPQLPELVEENLVQLMGDKSTDVESPQSLPPASPLPLQSRVRVSYVRSPSEISVQQQIEPLCGLTTAMNRFYGTPPQKPPGPLNASPGRLCAAFLEESWQRARVVDYLVGEIIVEVDLLDTGERRWIERCHLRPLASRFADLPAQCTMIQLELPAEVCKWSKTAGERLREMAEDCWLTCNVVDEEGARAQLVNDYGKSLSALLDAEGLCVRASRRVQITSTFALHVVRLGSRRYIFAFDLSGLLGWPGNSALEELERRGIFFRVQHLRRGDDKASWDLVAPLLPKDVDMVYLFPAENIVDAINALGFPTKQLSKEMMCKLSQLADDW